MSEPQPKKPFVEPHLVVYGTIQDITKAVGKTGAADFNGMGGKVKTR
jgi:hypothetical protein